MAQATIKKDNLIFVNMDRLKKQTLYVCGES
jgi:hypothetical protein